MNKTVCGGEGSKFAFCPTHPSKAELELDLTDLHDAVECVHANFHTLEDTLAAMEAARK